LSNQLAILIRQFAVGKLLAFWSFLQPPFGRQFRADGGRKPKFGFHISQHRYRSLLVHQVFPDLVQQSSDDPGV